MQLTRLASQGAIMELLSSPVFKTGHWSCITSKGSAGDYSRVENYLWNGIPVFRLEIQFNPPRTRAYVVERWRDIPVIDEETREISP